MKEAALPYYSPLAKQFAGIVNVISRSLLRNKSWYDAVQSIFATPSLHTDVINVYTQFNRWSTPITETHRAYAPTVLNEALHYVATSSNAVDSSVKRNFYSWLIVGILSAARWSITIDMYKNKINDTRLKTTRGTANKLSN